jgi:hypothetical protein
MNICIWSYDSPGGCIKGLCFTYLDQNHAPITVYIGGCSSSCGAVHENKRTIGAAWSTHCYEGRLKRVLSLYICVYIYIYIALSNCVNKLGKSIWRQVYLWYLSYHGAWHNQWDRGDVAGVVRIRTQVWPIWLASRDRV